MSANGKAPEGDSAEDLLQLWFDGKPVRALVGEDGMPWFNANDVCEALGCRSQCHRLVDLADVKDRMKPAAAAKRRNLSKTFVNESGLNAMILGFGKPQAKRFERWVASVAHTKISRTVAFRKNGFWSFG